MAVEISTKFSIDLSIVVSNSLEAVRSVRRREQAEKEAEFQRAVASGLSYDEQIIIRQTQLDKEKESNLSESLYIATLEKSIAETKRLRRFNKYRVRYAESLGELSSGKINEEEYLSILKSQLNLAKDPELRLEIQVDVSTAEAKVKTYRDTILSNQVKKARYDATKSSLNNVIDRINAARTEALINNNEDEVTAYDETLSSLRSQLATVRVQDSITDFQVKSSTRGTDVIEKLNYINTQIQGADESSIVRIGERTFTSARQFWSLERDNFLAGNSEIFGNFFEELQVTTKNTISVNSVKFGYPTQTILDEAALTFKDLFSRPEIAPFLNRVEIVQASVMADAVDKYAQHLIIISQGTAEFSFKEADIEIQRIGSKYGVDVTSRRVELQNLALTNQNIPETAVPELDLELPKVEVKKEVEVDLSKKTLRDFGLESDALIGSPEAIEFLLQLRKTPPTKVEIKPSVIPSEEKPSTIETTDQKPISTPISPIQTPVTPEQPTVPQSIYTGSSIVDYLKSIGQNSSPENRAKLALQRGVVKSEEEYIEAFKAGTNASFNTKLLNILRG